MALLYLSGCGSYSGSSMTSASAPPAWFLIPPMGCAAGSLGDQGSPHLTRIGAVTRARAELSRQIQVHIESVLTLYQEVGELEGRVAASEEMTSRSVQSTRAQLEGSQVRETATDQGTLYALVCVERARALRIISEVKRYVKVLAPRPSPPSSPAAPLGVERSSEVVPQDSRHGEHTKTRQGSREMLRARAQRALRELEIRLGE